jgi:hypothetical protein
MRLAEGKVETRLLALLNLKAQTFSGRVHEFSSSEKGCREIWLGLLSSPALHCMDLRIVGAS